MADRNTGIPPAWAAATGAAAAFANGVAYEFPGCRPLRISRDEIADFDGRYEYWAADAEIAWQVAEPTSPYHELPSQRLARLSDRIAAVRGSPIETFGTADLLIRNEHGDRHRILQADQILYLHPGRSRPLGHAVEVSNEDLPNVILEVDLTTDVRRGKLDIYESWGFPEVWVEVPENRAPSSPKRPPGLVIHLLRDGCYQPAPASVALSGWTAAEIHTALNEAECSAATTDGLVRVGRILGERAGTGPDDDLLLRAQRRESRHAGQLEGVRKVLEVLEILASRNIPVTAALAGQHDLIAAAPASALLRAAMLSDDADDLARRIESLT